MENEFFDALKETDMEIFDYEPKKVEDAVVITNDAYKCNEISKFLSLYGIKLLDGISALNNGTFRFLFNANDGCIFKRFKNIESVKTFLNSNGFNNATCKLIKLNLPVNANNQYYEVILNEDCVFFSDSGRYMLIPEHISNKVAKKKKMESMMDTLSKAFIALLLISVIVIIILSFVFRDKESDFGSLSDSIYKYETIEDFDFNPSKTVTTETARKQSERKFEFQYGFYDIEIVDIDGNVQSFPYSMYEVDGNTIVIQGYSPGYYYPVSFTILDKRNVKSISGKRNELLDE